MSESYVTFASDDISCLSCLVLCNSLKQTGTEKYISVLVNSAVSYHLRSVLQKTFDKVYFINDLCVISDGTNRYDVHGDYERLKCWLLNDFNKCVFLESDVLVVDNIDDLFDRMELSAVSDPRWPDCFDAGVFVFQPCYKTYMKLIDYSLQTPNAGNSFQCLLNMFFCDWSLISIETRIPFTYNCQMNTSFYTQTAALVHFGHSIKAARLGNSTFHLMHPDPSLKGANHDNWSRLWSKWWKIFNEMVKPAVDNNDKLNFRRTGVDYNQDSMSSSRDFISQDQHSTCITQDHASTRSEYTHPYQEFSYQGTESPNKAQDQEITCSSYGSSSSIQESVCPSQHFADTCQSTSTYSEPITQITQSFTEEEPIQSVCELLVVGDLEVTEDREVESLGSADLVISAEDMEKDHQLRWERGEIDYMGKDRFENILAQLNNTLVLTSKEETVDDPEETNL